MEISLLGKTALVTGASRGIGAAIAKSFAEAGAQVMLSSRKEESLREVAKHIDGETDVFAANTGDIEQGQACVDATIERFGTIDILVNNAGILRDKSFSKMEISDFRLVMEVHVMGAVHCTKAVWPIMQAQSYGRIVMTTSSSGL